MLQVAEPLKTHTIQLSTLFLPTTERQTPLEVVRQAYAAPDENVAESQLEMDWLEREKLFLSCYTLHHSNDEITKRLNTPKRVACGEVL